MKNGKSIKMIQMLKKLKPLKRKSRRRLKKKCNKCEKDFFTNVKKQILCSKCRETLVCKEVGCLNKVVCVEKELCSKHYARHIRKDEISKFICKNCKNEFINTTKHRKDYCDDCDEIKKHLICEIEGCSNKAMSFNIRKCQTHHTKRGKPEIEKQCVVCGKLFKTKITKRKYCCSECKIEVDKLKLLEKSRKISMKKRIDSGFKSCEVCGERFLPKLFYGKKQHCCSEGCRKKYSDKWKKNHYRENIKPNNHLNRGQSFPQMFIYEKLKVFFNELEWEYNNRRILKNPKTGKCLEIDIWCPYKRIGIEFDGIHHFKPKFGQKMFNYTKKMDSLKNKLCSQKYNIKLIRISYEDDWRNEKWLLNKIGDVINDNN